MLESCFVNFSEINSIRLFASFMCMKSTTSFVFNLTFVVFDISKQNNTSTYEYRFATSCHFFKIIFSWLFDEIRTDKIVILKFIYWSKSDEILQKNFYDIWEFRDYVLESMIFTKKKKTLKSSKTLWCLSTTSISQHKFHTWKNCSKTFKISRYERAAFFWCENWKKKWMFSKHFIIWLMIDFNSNDQKWIKKWINQFLNENKKQYVNETMFIQNNYVNVRFKFCV